MKSSKNNFRFKIILAMLSLGIPGYLYSQITSYESSPQYLFTDFSMSQVKMKNGQVYTTLLNYNTITQRMVFIKGNEYLDLTNYQMVDTIYLNDRVFIPVGKVYYEVLLSGPVSLFVQHIGKLRGKPTAYGRTSQASSNYYLTNVNTIGGTHNLPLPPDYIVEVTTIYWIRKANAWLDFTNKKQFLKLFPEKSTQLKNFIKENRLKIDKPEHLKNLVGYYNSLIVK